jgi:uncharacterized membrane protein YgdD (TMEM256/DUF423 family)
MDHLFFRLGAGSALMAVAAGAFAAHALRDQLAPASLAIFETAARYQMYHALALLAVAWAATHWPGTLPRWSGWCFVVGTILFSGSLYALALSGIGWLGAVTPLGGVALMLGWLCLALAATRPLATT